MANKDQHQPEEAGVSRRDLFQIIGAAPVLAVAAAGTAAAAEPHMHAMAKQAEPAKPFKRQTFDDHQWQTVHTLCDLIIPADERSGSATQAGVPEFMDDWLAFRTQEDGHDHLRAEIFGGLMWVDREAHRLSGKDFSNTPADQQKQILDRVAYPAKAAKDDAPWVAFFTQFRSLAVGGFYSSKIGVADLRFMGNVAVTEWKGCDPKVWAVIEDRLKNGYKGVLEAKPWGAA